MKYLELIKGQFTAEHEARAKQEEPYVAYSEETGGVMYSVIKEGNDLIYNIVDLGLPSGTLWADRNVGASSPEDTGLYFQWGDTVGYTAEQVAAGEKVFDWNHYFDTTDGGATINKYSIESGLKVLESTDDAAYIHMGADWRMPTADQIRELWNNTEFRIIDIYGNSYYDAEFSKNSPVGPNEVAGVEFTGSNGNSIFLPAAGYCQGSELAKYKTNCAYWSSNTDTYTSPSEGTSYMIGFNLSSIRFTSNLSRYFGYSIRGVKNPS